MTTIERVRPYVSNAPISGWLRSAARLRADIRPLCKRRKKLRPIWTP